MTVNFNIFVAGIVLDVVTDLMILVLPIRPLMSLNMKKGKKALVVLALVAGYAYVALLPLPRVHVTHR